jgi:hypothetical protein
MGRLISSLAKPLRFAVLAALAVMLVMRLGPACEAVANAAPIASDMSGCEGKSKPAKIPQQVACSTPCMAIPGEAHAYVEAGSPIRAAHRPTPIAAMAGMLVPPATPPPRTV